jgi:hypothetical protein
VELFLTAYLDTDEVSLQLVCSQKGIKFSPKITVDENTTFDNEGYGISLPTGHGMHIAHVYVDEGRSGLPSIQPGWRRVAVPPALEAVCEKGGIPL